MILRSWSRQRLTITLVTLVVSFGALAASSREAWAQGMEGEVIAPACGTITYPDEYEDYVEDITDCENPFGGTVKAEPDLMWKGRTIAPGDNLVVGQSDWGLFSTTFAQEYIISLFRQTEAHQYEFIRSFNPGNQYTKISSGLYTADEPSLLEHKFYFDEKSESTNWSVQSRNYPDSIPDYAVLMIGEYDFDYAPRAHLFKTGNYVLVLSKIDQDGAPQLGRNTPLKWLFGTTAQASEVGETVVIPFTVNGGDLAPEPAGASSVLFLPGIQASRLYKDGLLGTEDQLWVPNSNQDMSQITMNSNGSSVSDIYTKDVIDEVFGFGTVYKDFSTYLDSLISDNKINDWKAYAYDWRFSVEDIAKSGTRYENEIKNAADLLLELAEGSKSGKVTIIGHSNGGLLAKAIIDELVVRGEDDKVDTLILLAAPQLGTPKSIGVLLHGFDQDLAGGLLVSASMAREVSDNMPGAYGLLPTDEYIDTYETAPVRFSPGEATSIFSSYGEDIDSEYELDQFLNGQLDGRTSAKTVYEANVLNQNLLNTTRNYQAKIGKTWRAPQHVDVVEVVGVGLPTVAGFEYRNYSERKCTQDLFTESCTTSTIYKPVPIFSLWGDQTVMANSAEGYDGDKNTYYLDLRSYRQIKKIEHANFTEAKSVQDLVVSVLLKREVKDIEFVTDSKNNQVFDDYYVISSHSPVSLSVQDSDGNVTEVVENGDFYQMVEGIPGSQVIYHGSTTYTVIPSGSYYEITVLGTGSGSVTIEVDKIIDGKQENDNSVFIDSVVQNSKATFTIEDTKFSDINFDFAGDGTIDYSYNIDSGEKVIVETPKEVEVEVESNSSQTRVGSRKSFKQVYPAELTSAGMIDVNQEYYTKLYNLLVQLNQLLNLYAERNKY